MKVYPSSAEEKLGFDVLRARLETYVLSTLGEARLARMQPARQLGWLQAELERVIPPREPQLLQRLDRLGSGYPVRFQQKFAAGEKRLGAGLPMRGIPQFRPLGDGTVDVTAGFE